MSWLYNLNDIRKRGRQETTALAGGKGYGLCVISNLCLNLPDTWVAASDLFREFIKYTKKDLPKDLILTEAENFIAAKLRHEIDKLPDAVFAVRSSAIIEDSVENSFAGMFESKLDVDKKSVPKAIAEVWISGLSNRVKDYSLHNEWPEMAVIVQPMIKACFSGVCFSRHPSPGNIRENHNFLIEIVSGIGEKLVQGETTPVRLTGNYGSLVSCTDYPWVPELLSAVIRLEAETGDRVDVEFAVDQRGRLWLLQQRPVTKIVPSSTVDMLGYKKAYKRALCSLDIEFLIDGCAGYLPAYLEIPVDLTGWMVMLTNKNDGQQELWINKTIDEAMVSHVASQISTEDGYLDRLRIRYNQHHRRILNWHTTAWADLELPLVERLADFFEFAVPINAHYYSPMHIIEALSGLVLNAMRRHGPANVDDDFFALTTEGTVTLGRLFGAKCLEIKKHVVEQLGRLPGYISEIPDNLVLEMENMVEEYGFLNCHQPYESPYTLDDIFRMILDAQEPDAEAGENAAAVGRISDKYAGDGEWKVLSEYLLDWLNIRNQQMEYLYYVYAKAAPLLREAGNILGLSLEEVWHSDRTFLLNSLAHSSLAAKPYRHENLVIAHDGKRVILSDNLNTVFPLDNSVKTGITGKTVYGSGEISGTVKIAFTPEDIEDDNAFTGNVIVVTGMTTPDFVPLLAKKAAGLITDEGGILCHASIIAREIKMPCIVGTGDATERLVEGMKVRMDLDRGEIFAC